MTSLKPRDPYPGDVLLDPQRVVAFVDRERREFRCSHFSGAPPAPFRSWSAAPIGPDWTELPTDDALEGKP